ncbi:hypothetical protein [Accumulibacter sp.]|uniref:hypothetical protein n=1 Tax=Accumulibacter sp. TaxID=2053492 RepID=UPI00260C0D0C|nr:hypothetical protein [Accumulibacter sp.]
MRIPSEAIPPVTNLTRANENGLKAEPVEASARLANDLTASPQGRPSASGEQTPRRPAVPAAAPLQAATGTPLAGERRRAERRSEKRAVLLDTRSKKGRRTASGEGRISIKV